MQISPNLNLKTQANQQWDKLLSRTFWYDTLRRTDTTSAALLWMYALSEFNHEETIKLVQDEGLQN